MGTLQDARKILVEAEKALRAVAEEALRQQRYVDVSEVAQLADGLARLLRGQVAPRAESRSFSMAKTPAKRRTRSRKKTASKKAGYPRFARDRDRLVKIGWSKKKGAEYEHRAPFEVAGVLVDTIRGAVGEGELFSATDILPLVASDGGDAIPDYQAYLALKWLHTEGIVRKHGRDRYALEPGKLGEGGVHAYWERLPGAKATKNGAST